MNKSESIQKIATALAKFQGEMKNPPKNADNPFFKSKYCALDTIIDTIRPVMAKHGLSFIQSCSAVGAEVAVTTLVMHESGEWIESDPMTVHATKLDPQGAGSAITYNRRYSLSAVLGIASEEDDDGNSSSKVSAEKKAQADIDRVSAKTKEDAPVNWIEFWKTCKKMGFSESQVHEIAGTDSISGWNRQQVNELFEKLKVATKKEAK